MRSVVQLYPGPPSYRSLVARRWSLAFANDERRTTGLGPPLSAVGRASLVVGFCERRTATDERRGWGCSSAGRAPGLQPGGHRFDPGQLHQIHRRWSLAVRRWPIPERQRPRTNDQGRTTKDERPTTNSTLGVNATTDSVSRFKKVAWRRTLGWMTEGLHTPRSGQSIPA